MKEEVDDDDDDNRQQHRQQQQGCHQQQHQQTGTKATTKSSHIAPPTPYLRPLRFGCYNESIAEKIPAADEPPDDSLKQHSGNALLRSTPAVSLHEHLVASGFAYVPRWIEKQVRGGQTWQYHHAHVYRKDNTRGATTFRLLTSLDCAGGAISSVGVRYTFGILP